MKVCNSFSVKTYGEQGNTNSLTSTNFFAKIELQSCKRKKKSNWEGVGQFKVAGPWVKSGPPSLTLFWQEYEKMFFPKKGLGLPLPRERFGWFLTEKIDFESQVLALFDSLPLIQNSKFNNFLWVCWFLGKNLSNFVPPVWKLHNPYCHTAYQICYIHNS